MDPLLYTREHDLEIDRPRTDEVITSALASKRDSSEESWS